jgi:hypothetical protein
VNFLALHIQIRRDDGFPLSADDVETVTEYCDILSRALTTENVHGDPFDYLVEAFMEQNMILVELAAYPLEGLNLDQREELRDSIERKDVPQAEQIRARLEDHMGPGYEVNVILGDD